jgi:hypothetical protein
MPLAPREQLNQPIPRKRRGSIMSPVLQQPPLAESTPMSRVRLIACSTLQIVLQSLREGLQAYRRYEELRAKGVPHDTAIRQALGLAQVEP